MICPSRGRDKKIEKFYESFRQNSSVCDLVFSLDHDDEHNYKKIQDDSVFYEIGFSHNIVEAMNSVAYKYAQNDKYSLIGMLNDDHLIRTKDWDLMILEQLKNEKIAIAYPNDLFTKENCGHDAYQDYASAVFMTPNIVKSLGWFANPLFTHNRVDWVWIDLGKKLEKLFYFENIIFEHMHPFVRKDVFDERYLFFQSEPEDSYNVNMLNFYRDHCIDNDVLRIKKYVESNE